MVSYSSDLKRGLAHVDFERRKQNKFTANAALISHEIITCSHISAAFSRASARMQAIA